MTITFERQWEIERPGLRELRYEWSGIDIDTIASERHVVPGAAVVEVGPRYFWFSLCGIRSRALAYIFCRFTKDEP